MGGSKGVPGMALHPYPSSAPPVTNSSVPVQKLASEARNTAAAPTSAGWPMRPRGWGETREKGDQGKPPPDCYTLSLPYHMALAPHAYLGQDAFSDCGCGVRRGGGQLLPQWGPDVSWGDTVGREKRGSGKCATNTASWAHFLPSPPIGAAHQLTRTPY